MTKQVDRLVLRGIPVLELVARRIARRLGRRVELDDLLALGRPALLEIARTYDPSRSKFSTFATQKIHWAIFDGLRRETRWRSVAARAGALAASARFAESFEETSEGDLPPTPEAHQERLRALLDGHAAALALGLGAVPPEPGLLGPGSISGESDSPEEQVARAELAVRLRCAVGRLPERERALVERHYFDGEQFDAIAADLGISKSWASRLHARAIQLLAVDLRTSED